MKFFAALFLLLLSTSQILAQSVDLTWNASTDNVAVTGYHVYRNGVLIGSTPTTSYTDATGLQPSTAYTYTVTAYDAAGNESGPSIPVIVTTLARPNLPADRDASANWKKAGLQSIGGIPSRTTVCATVQPSTNATAAINAAISACPVGQVVALVAGSYTIPEGNPININKAITLRGAGAGSTILTRTNGAKMGSYIPGSNQSPIVTLQGGGSGGTSALAADAVVGSYSVTVANASGFAAGQVVELDETSGAGWQPDRVTANSGKQIWAAPDYRVVWQKHNPTLGGDDFGSGSYPYTSGSAGCWFSNCDRPTTEEHLISAISGNTLTFDSPIMISYRTSHAANVTHFSTLAQAGVENLTAEYGDDGNFKFANCLYCWAKNVESRFWLNQGFHIISSFRTQLEGVYSHTGVWPVNGGGGYAISLDWGSGEALVQNSISILANKVMVARSSGAGSVIAYNYMDMGFIAGQGWVEAGANASHMVGPHHVLFEGNWAFNAESDQTHGNAIYQTFFRNWLTGYRSRFTDYLNNTVYDDAAGCCSPRRAASPHGYSYWNSFIGNVLGTSGKTSGWSYNCISGTNNIPNNCIWMLGWIDISPQGNDPQVAVTTIRDGNWDFVSNAQKWETTPAGFTIPNSLYLTAKPTFFGANVWPWVDPTTGRTYTLPAKARFDAGTPNNVQ